MRMNKFFSSWLQRFWYQELYLSSWLMPISMLYVDIMRLRRFLYRIGILKSSRLPVPVIIVGNITVGGTGKTPLVIYLVQLLREQGFNPGVISRGYNGEQKQPPQIVTIDSDPLQVGDEPLLVVRRSNCPVVVCADRAAAGRHLLANFPCDVLIADDGLQHYALKRDIEIAVVDGARRFGNGYCLPVGPLREPPARIQEVDLVVVNGGHNLEPGEFAMDLRGSDCINLVSGEQRPLADFRQTELHAVAAIGNPGRFFKQLQQAGLQTLNHAFPDHYAFQAADLSFNDSKPVLMTEKDAVKCQAFAQPQHWYVPVTAYLDPRFTHNLLTLLAKKHHG